MVSEYSSSKKSTQPGSLIAESTNSLVREANTEKPEPLGFKTKWYQFKNGKFGNLKMATPTTISKRQTRTANQDLNESHVVNESSSWLVRSKVPKPASELVLCRDVTLYDWTSFPRILNLATFKFAQNIESFTAHKNQPKMIGDAWDMAYSCFLKPGRSTSNSEGIILSKMENVEGDIFLSVSQYMFDEIAKKIHLFLTLTEAKLALCYSSRAEIIISYLNTCEISVINQFLSESSKWTFGNRFVGQHNIQRGISTVINGTAKLLNTEIRFQDVYVTVISHAISMSVARLYQSFQESTKHVLLFYHHQKYITNAIVKLGCREVACQYNRENIASRLTVFLEKMYEELYENGIHKKISKLKKEINSTVSEIRGNFKNEISRIMKQNGSFSDLHAFHKGFHNALHITVCKRLIFKTNHDSEIIDHVVMTIGKDLEVDMQTYNEIYNVTNPNQLNIVHLPQSSVEYLKTSSLPETIAIFISYDKIACGIVVDHYLYKIRSASLNIRSKIWISESDTGVMNECDPMFSQCVKNQNVAMYCVEDALGLVWKPRLPKLPFNSTEVTQEFLFACILKWLSKQCVLTLGGGNYRYCIVVPAQYSCINIQKLRKAASLIDNEATVLTTACCLQTFSEQRFNPTSQSSETQIGVPNCNGLQQICHLHTSIELFLKTVQSIPKLGCCCPMLQREEPYDENNGEYDFKMYCGLLPSCFDSYHGGIEQQLPITNSCTERKFFYSSDKLHIHGIEKGYSFNLTGLHQYKKTVKHNFKEQKAVYFYEWSNRLEFIGTLFIEAAVVTEKISNRVKITCQLTREMELDVKVDAPHIWSRDVIRIDLEVNYRSILNRMSQILNTSQRSDREIDFLPNKVESHSEGIKSTCIENGHNKTAKAPNIIANDIEPIITTIETNSVVNEIKIEPIKCELSLLIVEIKQQAIDNSSTMSSFQKTRIRTELEKYSNIIPAEMDRVAVNKAIIQLKKLQQIWFKNITVP